MVEETIAWFAGVDWGSAKHQACLLGAQGGIVGEREFPHSGKGLSELADWILSMTGIASAVAVAVEVPHGPVVDVLLDRGFIGRKSHHALAPNLPFAVPSEFALECSHLLKPFEATKARYHYTWDWTKERS